MLCEMDLARDNNQGVSGLRTLYPELSAEDLARAEDSVTRYVALALRVFTRLQAEKESCPQTDVLTEPADGGSVRIERSNPTENPTSPP